MSFVVNDKPFEVILIGRVSVFISCTQYFNKESIKHTFLFALLISLKSPVSMQHSATTHIFSQRCILFGNLAYTRENIADKCCKSIAVIYRQYTSIYMYIYIRYIYMFIYVYICMYVCVYVAL